MVDSKTILEDIDVIKSVRDRAADIADCSQLIRLERERETRGLEVCAAYLQSLCDVKRSAI